MIAALLLGSEASAYPLNPWGGVTSARTVAFTQYAYVTPDGLPLAPYVSVGLGHDRDLYVGASGTVAPNGAVGFGALEVFPRFFVGGEWGLTPHLLWSPGTKTATLAPEVHWFHRDRAAALTLNTGWRPTLDYGRGEAAVGQVFVQIAPEVFVSDRFAVYLEVDDFVDVAAVDSSLTLVPGVWWALDEAGKHSIALAPQLAPMAGSMGAAWSVGAWYSTAGGF